MKNALLAHYVSTHYQGKRIGSVQKNTFHFELVSTLTCQSNASWMDGVNKCFEKNVFVSSFTLFSIETFVLKKIHNPDTFPRSPVTLLCVDPQPDSHPLFPLFISLSREQAFP